MAVRSTGRLTVHRLALGTARLGAPYGVAGGGARVAPEEAARILGRALDLGVDYLDTAPSYGEAEEVLGRLLRREGASRRFRVATKLSELGAGLTSRDVAARVREAVAASCRRLGVDRLDELLLHAPRDLERYGPALLEPLLAEQAAGRVMQLGVSVYDPGDAAALGREWAVLQLPFNAFDFRWTQSGGIARHRGMGRTVVARSALLQGLLTLAPAEGEARVPGSALWLECFRAACARHGVSPVAGALGFAAGRSGADYLLVGVESVAQLDEVHGLVTAPPDARLGDALAATLGSVPESVRDPRRWPAA